MTESGESAFFARVTGRVQGVGFRYTCKEAAEQLVVKGWVRNTDDGNVEVWAEGSEEVLTHFTQWLHRGPPRARVDSLDVSPQTPSGAFHGFSIKF